jgi:predicted TIM-barrel fold metal-dependent hydrolase
MEQLAACSNTVAKLSGLGTFIHRNDPVHVTDVLSQTVEIFGAARCMFGSNFPIEKLWTSYRSLIDAYLAATAPLRADQRDAIFRSTGMRVYRLSP